jgi:hypothetical protein
MAAKRKRTAPATGSKTPARTRKNAKPAAGAKAAARAKPGQHAGTTRQAPAEPTRPKRTIPVHALADERIHLALAQPGRLRQGYLKTLCGLQVVSALSPFALADRSQKQCRTCFGKVDSDGTFGG